MKFTNIGIDGALNRLLLSGIAKSNVSWEISKNKPISRAVDVAEIVRKRFTPEIDVKSILINIDESEENKVASIEIILDKKSEKSKINIDMSPEELDILRRIQTILSEVKKDKNKMFQLGENLHRAIGIPEEKINEAKKAVGETLDKWAKSLGADEIEPKTKEALINEVLLLVWLTL